MNLVKKYRTKPDDVEIISVTDAIYAFGRDWKSLPKWLETLYNKGGVVPCPQSIFFEDNEAKKNQYILYHPKTGDIEIISQRIFETRFEES